MTDRSALSYKFLNVTIDDFHLKTKMRFTDAAFQKHCNEKLKNFYEIWRSKIPTDRELPAKSAFLPEEMPKFLSRLILVECLQDQDDFRYRIVGTDEVETRGSDPTGQLVSSNSYGDEWSKNGTLANYRTSRDEKTIVYDSFKFKTSYGHVMRDETLFLPLSDDGEIVNMIFVISTIVNDKN